MYLNKEDLRFDLEISAGYYRQGFDLDGQPVKRAKSISFAAMDELEFNKLYDDVVKVIVTHFHFNKEALLHEVAKEF